MPDTLYEDFYDPTEAFSREPRAFCYEMAISLIDQSKGDNIRFWYTDTKTVQAILLLLFCWNFAARETKRLTMESTRKVLRDNENCLRQLENFSLFTFTPEVEPLIRSVFSRFRRVFGQTGATKALSLINPALFVMWDTKIRQRLRRELIRGIDNGQTAEQYILFLRGIREYAYQYNFQQQLKRNAILAKKIDEYHYVKIVMS